MAEHEPLLGVINDDLTRVDDLDKDIIVDFGTDDKENPLNWSRPFKWAVVGLLALMALTTTFTCISVVPVANSIIKDLNQGAGDKSKSVLLVTIWELGEAAGPLFLAPLSEAFGRYPVYNVANICFIAATVMAALCQTAETFVAARALTGLAVAANVLNPAIVGDIFISEERGSPMSFIMLAPLLGGAVGPAVAGTIAEHSSWRNILWMSIGLASACELTFLTYFRETYKVTILRRNAAKLRQQTGNDQISTIFDVTKGQQRPSVWQSILRPFVVFWSSGVLKLASLFGCVSFSFFYIMSTTLPDILEGVYGLPPSLIGLCFITFSVGSVVSVAICNFFLDRIYVSLRESNKGNGMPEYRLPLVIFGGFALPIAIVLYGWVPQFRFPLPICLISVGLLGAMLIFGYLPLSTFVVDSFGLYSASAMTALIVTRCVAGTFLPLLTQPLVDRFDYGWGLTIMAGVAFCLAPVPIILFRYGSRWRAHSAYSREA